LSCSRCGVSGDSQTRQMRSGEFAMCLPHLIADRMNKFLLAGSVPNKGEMLYKMYSPELPALLPFQINSNPSPTVLPLSPLLYSPLFHSPLCSTSRHYPLSAVLHSRLLFSLPVLYTSLGCCTPINSPLYCANHLTPLYSYFDPPEIYAQPNVPPLAVIPIAVLYYSQYLSRCTHLPDVLHFSP